MLSYFMRMIFGASVPAPFPRDQRLLSNPYPQVSNPEIYAAYDQCLQSQADAGDDVKLLMYARCLGFLIIEAPTEKARDYLSSEIMQCGGDANKMNNLAKFYIENLFRLFRKYKGHTPRPSFHSSRSWFGEERLFFSSTVDPAPEDHRAAKRAALERDNLCCMVTGCVDTEYYLTLSANDRIAIYPPQVIVDHTNFTHIFPPSTSRDLEPEQPSHSKTDYAGTVWDTVLKYGDINVLDELNGSHCHRLYNGLTLIASVRNDFDRLLLWFEAIPNAQHTYRVCTLIPICGSVHTLPHPRIVTFSTTTGLPLPDPRYLKLHAVVCRVGHLSGVTTYLDTYDREQTERNFLARDGSSAEYLTSCLHSVLGA